MRVTIIVASVCFVSSYALQAEQTDWSGGYSFSGAVSEWTNCFDSAETVAWASIPGQIQLSSIPLQTSVEHLVFSGIAKPYCASIGDLNGDGFNDIAMGALEAGVVHVYYGASDGTWTEQVLSSDSPAAIGIAIADLNGDALPDVAVCASTSLQIFYNQGGTVPSWENENIGSGFSALHEVEAEDMDMDGDNDLVVADCDGDRLFWMRNEGGSSPDWTDLTIDSVIDYPCKVHLVDLDQDGNMDVVCAAWTGDVIQAFYGSGGQNPVWTSQIIDPSNLGAHGVRACDIDDDGDLDVLGASLDGGVVYLYRNEGGAPIQWERETVGSMVYSAIVRTGDIDGDGDPDILSSSFGNAGVAWWENTENGTTFVKHIVKSGGQSVSWTMPGDLDNDGDLDVLSVRYQGNSMYWYEVTSFQPSGSLVSEILDTGEVPQWASFEWSRETPPGCTISLQFKSSDDSSAMGNWSQEYYASSELSGLLERFFQYRINMNSSDTSHSPVLKSFELNWDPLGIEGSCESEETKLINYPSPCVGQISVHTVNSDRGSVNVNVYSSAGRLLLSESVYSGDVLSLEGISSGIYFIQAVNEEGITQTGSTVLISR